MNRRPERAASANDDPKKTRGTCIVQSSGRQYAGTYSSGGAFTSGNYTGNFSGTAVDGSVYGHTYGSGYATTNTWGTSVPLFRGKASVLIIKFK
jgi:hypothetical protein